ncbi:WAT1-related protein At2g37460-like [Musa acuminata AAA Group]|uniref:WAT1-related protein At2g37460-like n=1 Tax=Musa acuminata AAA Group TaxID=214697 RepID=UPI0031D73F53
MGIIGEAWRSVKPYLVMVFLQLGYAGMFVVSVASLKRGMSHYVLVVYRNAVAALWFEGKVRPKMTLPIFLKIMALALLEPVLDQNFYYMGTKYTSASFSSALYNKLPAVTFVSAIVLRGVVMKERGPVFVTAFNPLCMVIVAVMGSIILAEEISLGRVIGAVIIVIGLYALARGMSSEMIPL